MIGNWKGEGRKSTSFVANFSDIQALIIHSMKNTLIATLALFCFGACTTLKIIRLKQR